LKLHSLQLVGKQLCKHLDGLIDEPFNFCNFCNSTGRARSTWTIWETSWSAAKHVANDQETNHSAGIFACPDITNEPASVHTTTLSPRSRMGVAAEIIEVAIRATSSPGKSCA
jgi:hypothetical protein